MNEKTIPSVDADALALFARKGREGGPNVPQAGLANGVKVRRVMQSIADLAGKPFDRLRILDLGCGEGVYAIEAALHGAEVLAVDARRARMDQGAEIARRHGLDNVAFVQSDARTLSPETHGIFDVVLFLGLLYHLDAPELFPMLENVYEMCGRLLLIDTLVALEPKEHFDWKGQSYEGLRWRAHEDDDPPEVRMGRLLRSIDSTFAFRLTPESLHRALHAVGFSSVYGCHVPFEPGKADDRLTLAAVKGSPVRLSTYPWVNGKDEAEIRETLVRSDA
jgi:SAM-dependent methyltransferase